MKKATIMFPSPCGDVMFQDTQRNTGRFSAVSVPLRGCAISIAAFNDVDHLTVSVPLRGCDVSESSFKTERELLVSVPLRGCDVSL